MKRGKPMDDEITERVQIAVEHNKTTTVENIRRWIKKVFKHEYSWNTIRHHLDKLIEQDVVAEDIISDTNRKISVIKLKL